MQEYIKTNLQHMIKNRQRSQLNILIIQIKMTEWVGWNGGFFIIHELMSRLKNVLERVMI